ncbi:TetR/AcrR family transcriptional regulator [Kitasatospora herbaricolor]|uniref:TetR/AcrR family transcriptional regulator n=1 Tax=Kitasatospora herbaricolor TaxID=68217 RepID=UPI0036DF77CB
MPEDAATPPPPRQPGPAAHAQPMRADARRNYERIVAAAGTVIAEHGAEASLEQIARHAGVGSATLHRHFPTRQALLETVFKGRVEALCAKAEDLLPGSDPAAALITWLRAVGAHAVANRGLGAALMQGAPGEDPTLGTTCHAMIVNAGEALLTRASQAGAVRPEVTTTDLLKLVSAVALATEREPDGPAEADRLLTLAVDGVRTR